MVNLTKTLRAVVDRNGARRGDWKATSVVAVDRAAIVAVLALAASKGTFLRIIYRCADGRVRDVIGRQGVYSSQQDGDVAGTGHAMAKDGETVSFWSQGLVNERRDSGYRTLRIDGILAIKVAGVTMLTPAGKQTLGL